MLKILDSNDCMEMAEWPAVVALIVFIVRLSFGPAAFSNLWIQILWLLIQILWCRLWATTSSDCKWRMDDNYLFVCGNYHLDLSGQSCDITPHINECRLEWVHGENDGDQHIHGSSPSSTGWIYFSCVSLKVPWKTIHLCMTQTPRSITFAMLGLWCGSVLSWVSRRINTEEICPSWRALMQIWKSCKHLNPK